jgi:hypothetical protein
VGDHGRAGGADLPARPRRPPPPALGLRPHPTLIGALALATLSPAPTAARPPDAPPPTENYVPPVVCPSGAWTWAAVRFGQRLQPQPYTLSVADPPGRLLGTDRGEFGGELTWVPAAGEPQVIWRGNINGLATGPSGVVAVSGLAHMGSNYGWVLRLTREQGAWRVRQAVELPGAPHGLAVIAPDLYATWNAGRALVFTPHSYLGVAECVGGAVRQR